MDSINNSIALLENKITQLLDECEKESKVPVSEQSSLHYEYIGEKEDLINDYRRGIVVLETFALKDLDYSIIKINRQISESFDKINQNIKEVLG